MRAALRIFRSIIKSVLLLGALAALVMWPVSRGRSDCLFADRISENSSFVEWRAYSLGCFDGRLTIARAFRYLQRDEAATFLGEELKSRGKKLKWRRISHTSDWKDRFWPSRWGPFTWKMDSRGWSVAAPLWLIALVLGVWPAVSLAGFIVRRRRRHKAAREGLCERCGYDLRATPAAGGQLLAVCPECGAKTSTRNTPSPPPS